MEGGAVADAREALLVLGTAFAAIRVADAGLRHQVAFVTGIDEHFGGERVAILNANISATCAPVFRTPSFSFRRLRSKTCTPRFLQHFAKDVLGYVRLVDPTDLLSVTRQLIMPADAQIKL